MLCSKASTCLAFLIATIATPAQALSPQQLVAKCAPIVAAPVESCRLERLAVGNTNELYSLCTDDARYLVRVFGENAALAFDRDRENVVFGELAARGLAPRLLGTFDGGRVEGWLEGRPATAAECAAAGASVARALGRLHAEGPADAARPWAWTTAETWLENARRRQAAFADDPSPYAARVRALDLDAVSSALDELRVALPEDLPACFCHNDLSNTNVLLAGDGAVSLVDFEYGGSNFRGFDLATHLSHWAGGAVDGLYDDAAYPDDARPFVEAYCAATGAGAAAVEAEIAAALPLAHAVWGLWAICSLPDVEEAPFSHIEYAERRLAACSRAMPRPDDGMQRAETARPDDGMKQAETARADDGMQKAETALYGALDGAVALLGTVVFATTCLNVAGYGVVVEDGGLLFGTLPELRMRATLAGD